MAQAQDLRFTDSQLLEVWRAAIDPKGIGMPTAIATEIADYTGETVATVLARMEGGKEDFRELWQSSNIDPADQAQVENFYREQFIEAYELANWHCGRTNGQPPLNYSFAAALAKRLGLSKALDFGSGIGSGSVALAIAGCEVHSADIALGLLRFVGARMKARGFDPVLLDLKAADQPRLGYYEVITCFDVLEHVPDQLAVLRQLEGYLAVGGYLLINLMDDSSDSERPMHISSAHNWLRMVRQTGLQPRWGVGLPGSQVLQKTPMARYRNRLALVVDMVQGR